MTVPRIIVVTGAVCSFDTVISLEKMRLTTSRTEALVERFATTSYLDRPVVL